LEIDMELGDETKTARDAELLALAENETATHELDALTKGQDGPARAEIIRGLVQLNGAGLAGAIAMLSVQQIDPATVAIAGAMFYAGLASGLFALVADISPGLVGKLQRAE
jgi:hypothetical protein